MCSLLTWKRKNRFPLHRCRVTKYFLILLTILGIEYSECLFVSLPYLPGMPVMYFLRHVILSSVACTALQYFSILYNKRRDLGGGDIENTICAFNFIYKTCLKHFSF
jgi:hypothetical protein